MEREFTGLSAVIQYLDESSRQDQMDKDLIIARINASTLPADVCSDHDVKALVAQIQEENDWPKIKEHVQSLNGILRKFNSIRTR